MKPLRILSVSLVFAAVPGVAQEGVKFRPSVLFSSAPVVETYVPDISTAPVRRPFQDPSGLGRRALVAVTHVHSTISQSGVLEIEEIARLAVEADIDVLIPTDHLVSQWEYGVWPFRSLLKKKVVHPSVLEFGPKKYLDRLAKLKERFPGLIVLPGLEVAPFYRWSGSYWKGLVIEDWHRHLLVLGLDRPEDFKLIPVLGSQGGKVLKPFLFWPFVLALTAWVFRKAHYRKAAVGMLAIALLGLVECFPFTGYPEDQYSSSTPWAPYQRVVDFVRDKGGISLWAHPESKSFFKKRPVGKKVSIRTTPYPSAVRRVLNHDGFGAFVEGMRKVAQYDGAWDGALRQYVRGSREVIPWAFGELDFRKPGMNKTYIDTVRMIIFPDKIDAPSILSALKTGRFYSERSAPAPSMVLENWTLSIGGETGGSGEFLYGGGSVKADLAVSHSDGKSRLVELTMIRDGEIIFKGRQKTPAGWRLLDKGPVSVTSYYRALLKDEKGVQIVTNPIFRTLKEPS